MTKVPLKEIIAAVDLNSRTLWDELDDDQRKSVKNELWILNRYISNVKTDNVEQQQHFVLTVNEYFNKNWFVLQKDHPKLLWILLCMCNYNANKVFYHEWIGLGKKTNNKRIKILEKMFLLVRLMCRTTLYRALLWDVMIVVSAHIMRALRF